jgi:hypothetical protein
MTTPTPHAAPPGKPRRPETLRLVLKQAKLMSSGSLAVQ